MEYRVYFNRKREAPQVWSIDEGNQASEVNVIAFHVYPGCTVGSRFNGEPANDNSPSAWIEVVCDNLVLRNGVAYFMKRPNG